MTKDILRQYTDACALVKETEERIEELEQNRTILTDKVNASMKEFPYTQTKVKIEGSPMEELRAIDDEERALRAHAIKASRCKYEVEDWLLTCPIRIRRLIQLKFFDGLSWEEVADRTQRQTSGEAVRKEVERYLKQEDTQ